ncbi:hypothetical protein GAYE_SCF13G3424 [Galdieria yellowstonensis]|uniref:30S ribosomal protein S21 n=1 Tax=Galdieria yellowstonensis TaxID=3028027 RepID=A0AAV9IEA0_9RHOD|nr:hypothetical protein GAYE_SCF13G3424 [Galdieria yellowstonensis]
MQTSLAFSCWTPLQRTSKNVVCSSSFCKNSSIPFHATNRRSCVFPLSFFGAPVVSYKWEVAANLQRRQFGSVSMEVRVDVGEGEPIDSAIARFRREVSKSGHLFELKRRQEFEPNSVKRQRKRKQALRKAKLALFRGKKLENLRKDIL